MNHKQKLKMARKMMSEEERKQVKTYDQTGRKRKIGTSPFNSKAWNDRREAIQKRVERKEAIAKKRAQERRERRQHEAR